MIEVGRDIQQIWNDFKASRNQELRNLPAAALTAYARSEDRVRALRSGFNMHLSKPIDPAELLVVIETLVKSSQG